jgi:hypothetical protein
MYRKLVLGAMVERNRKSMRGRVLFSGDGSSCRQREYFVTGIELCHLEATELNSQRVAFFGNSFSVQASTTQGWTL